MKNKQKKRPQPQQNRSEKDTRGLTKSNDPMGVRIPAKTRKEVVKRKAKASSTWTSFFISVAARLSLYYAIYLYFWTCPAVSDQDSPLVCRGGDWLKTTLKPHVEPLYNEHLAPYVDKVSPYVKIANEKYIHPTGVYVAKQYDIYGKPRVEEAKVIIIKEYDRVVAPRVDKATQTANAYYDRYLADHVTTGKEIYVAVQPHISWAAGKAYEKGYPLYVASLPYIEAAWAKFVELLGWASVEGKGWVSRRWGMHVEPQLWRIQQKLGKKLAGDEATSGSPVVTEADPSAASAPNDSATAGDTELPVHLRPETRQAIEDDLQTWSTKFSTAGEKAISDITEKLNVLCNESLEKEKNDTNDMLDALEDNIANDLNELVKAIDEVSASSDGQQSKELAIKELVKTAGVKIQAESKKVHTHSQDVLEDVYDKTRKIVDAALAVLDSVHDVGIQELGMKWAWMDGVTYQDWAKYNDLKKSFEGSKQNVIRAGQSHQGLRDFVDFTYSVESETKEIVNEASKKLFELQENGLKEKPKQEEKTPEPEKAPEQEKAPEPEKAPESEKVLKVEEEAPQAEKPVEAEEAPKKEEASEPEEPAKPVKASVEEPVSEAEAAKEAPAELVEPEEPTSEAEAPVVEKPLAEPVAAEPVKESSAGKSDYVKAEKVVAEEPVVV